MSDSVQSNLVFLNLVPICKAVKAKMPKACKTLFSPAAASELRRRAFISLLEAIETDWIVLSPQAMSIPNRRRATLSLYALVNGSPLDACSDAELERLMRVVMPTPNVRATHALAESGVRFAAV